MLICRNNCPAQRILTRFVAWLSLAVLAACAARDYQPAPIAVDQTLASLENRSAASPAVQAFFTENGVDTAPWPPAHWDIEALALVAAFYHPGLDVARAEWKLYLAAETTASRRPNPGIEPVLEYHSEPDTLDTPWSVGFALQIPVEVSDKRGARIARARALSETARLRIGQTAWAVRQSVRERYIDLFAVEARSGQVTRELDVRQSMVQLLERRLALGETDAVTVGTAKLLLQQGQMALNATRREIAVARTSLANALSLPAEAVAPLAIATDRLSDWTAAAFPDAAVQRTALLNRLDIREALARYQAAEARLRLEVARQYPDVTLSPGFLWDQGDLVWSVGAAILAPLFDINRGPIAEADAARTLEAARFTALQSRVLGTLDHARAAHAAAGNALNSAQTLWHAQNVQLERVRQRFAAGEAGRLAVLEAELALLVAERAVLDERVNALRAFGLLEDAVQRPLDGTRLPGGIGASAGLG